MEAYTVDIEDFREMLTAHLDPIKDTIARLERQQEKIVDLMTTQASMLSTLRSLEDNFRTAIEDNTKTHDSLFERLRKVEGSSSAKLWDILKLIIAALFGGIVARY